MAKNIRKNKILAKGGVKKCHCNLFRKVQQKTRRALMQPNADVLSAFPSISFLKIGTKLEG
jgi:hypothetical protein